MDRSVKKCRREKKKPRVPIKTYRWEDVRRARKRGGYPWTYLYKPPFDELLDTESYTMEGLRKTKSASTMAKSSDMDISEVSDFESSVASGDFPEKVQIVTEPPEDHSIKDSPSSVIIEECEDKSVGDTLRPSESWDNISQYLDKEETDASVEQKETPPQQETASIPIPEQSTQRKRKLSAESSYSKISQTKSAILKKIKDTKNKIKVPKLTFPTSKLKSKKSPAKKNSPPEVKKETKVSASHSQKDVKPVYIHIPLRPPPGHVDEFSHLEFDNKTEKKEKPRKPGSFRDLVKQMKQVQEEAQATSIQETKEEKSDSEENKENFEPVDTKIKTEEAKSVESKKESTEKEKLDEEKMDTTILSAKDKLEVKTLESIFEKCEKYTKPAIQSEEKPTTTEGEEEYEGEDIFEHLFKTSSTKREEKEKPTTSKESDERVRSKSAEPEGNRRKLSMDSSYSRKSLSRLNFIKKLKDATEKVKSTLTRTGSKKKKPPPVPKKEEEPKKEIKKSKDLKPKKPIEPVYIHIPLKPPEGQTDEFSYLANDEKPKEPPVQTSGETATTTSSTPTTPTTPPDTPERKEGVQFIILTAPSDDEILDYNSSDVPETPSSEKKPFFVTKITELKQLAKEVADNVESKKKLDSVEEESTSDKEGNGKGKETVKLTEAPEGSANIVKSSKKIVNDKQEVDQKGEGENNKEKLNGQITENKKVEEVGKKDEDEKKVKTVDNEVKKVEDTKSKEAANKIIVDEEDGLNETVTEASKKIKEEEEESGKSAEKEKDNQATIELKSSLKGGSPVMKKKVSFKRRSRSSKDGSYEDIQAPESEINIKKIEEGENSSQLLTGKVEDVPSSVIDRVMKERAIEEEKWSKMTDHEYEPVNPPPDNVELPTNLPPTVYIVDTDYDTNILPIGSISFETTSTPPKPKEDIEVQNETPVVLPSSTKTTSSGSSQKTKETPSPSKFQQAFKQQTDNFKNKLHNIKRPHITLPERPKFNKPDFKKFKINKPKINLPKIPDTAKINLPHFSLHSGKRSLNQRQLSTESQDGDSKKPIFDFSTYPRRIKDKFKTKRSQDSAHFATVPRTKKEEPKQESSGRWSGSESIRIPLHSEDSMDLDEKITMDEEINGQDESYRNDENPSHVRYDEDIDIDDDYERENNELNQERDFMNRWNQGRFNEDFNEEYLQNLKNSKYKVTDLDSPEENSNIGYNINTNDSKDRDRDRYSSGSSFGHRRGVIEEINSDEFFWRPKGISQDDINVSMNISSEIREAFRTPANALTQIEKIQDQNEEISGSRQSLPEIVGKRRPIKKPKRKKTPHTSQEKIQRAEESADEDFETSPPSRPKRRSKRKKKDKNPEDVIPYRETISVDIIPSEDRFHEHRESLGMLGDDEQDEEVLMYENEKMEGKERPTIAVSDSYTNFEFADEDDEVLIEKPAAPPRKQKSQKSLNISENDSILEGYSANRHVSQESGLARDMIEPELEAIRTESKVIIPIQTDVPPKRPSRTRSRTNSQSRGTSQFDEESLGAESISRIDYDENESRIPCVEEPCVQDIRDYMGYAIVDKTKLREPPLPPPRLPNRQKRSSKLDKDKFNTVPRAAGEEVPVRPLRNYSTLTQAKQTYNAYENKENIDITQYIEIEEEPAIDHLQSGEVIQKMKDRPLPAPPRPPRKTRLLKDITSKENIMQEVNDEHEKGHFEEIEVSTQTEQLPDDFVCEELVQESSDKIIMPSASVESRPKDTTVIERRLITPTYYTHEETVTHGSLLVEPLNGAQLLPDHQLSKERIIPVTRDMDDETSSIPEEFTKLSDPVRKPTENIRPSAATPTETEVLKAHKLQVTDLDVEKLTVNQLLANKIIVSEIDSSNIQTNEITSKTGAIRIGEINLPPEMISQIIQTIRSSQSEADEAGQKKKLRLKSKKIS